MTYINHMHSFSTAVGHLGRNPEVVETSKGERFTRFCLVANDVYQNDEDCIHLVTTIWCMACEEIGEEIAKEARKGDQLITTGMIFRDHAPKFPVEGRDDFACWCLAIGSVPSGDHLELLEHG
jgi:hypothetical protein